MGVGVHGPEVGCPFVGGQMWLEVSQVWEVLLGRVS